MSSALHPTSAEREPARGSTAEADIAAALREHDAARAATILVDAYGSEIYGFLAAQLRSRADASEVYSVFLEHIWTGLEGFEGRCSARGWAYALARNAAHHFVTSPHRRRNRNLRLSAEEVSRLVHKARTETAEYLRSENRDGVRRLREELQEEERLLLLLRVDRGLPWREIAIVLSESGQPLTETETARQAARLRKQFERVKQRLVDLAREHGLLG